jgi:hypothetical protein
MLGCGVLVAASATITKRTKEKGVYLPAQSILFNKNSEEINFAEGNHSATENNYQLLVYYYDRNAGFFKCGGNFIQNSRRN